MSSKRNFWRGTSKFTLFIFRSFQEKRKNFSVGRKRRRGNARKRREVPSAESSSPFSRQKDPRSIEGNRKLGKRRRSRKISQPKRKEKERNAMKALPSDWNRIGILRNDCSPIEEQQTGNPLDSIALAHPASTKESELEICDRRRDTMPRVQAFFQPSSPSLPLLLLRNCRLSQPSLPSSPGKRFTRLPFNDFENENKRPPFNRGRGGASK